MGLFLSSDGTKHTRGAIMTDKKLPAVPETILKRRKRQQEHRAARAANVIKGRVARRAKRVDIFKRAEKYVKEYRDAERDELRLTREAKKGQLLCRCRTQVSLCHAYPWYQPGRPQGSQSFATFPSQTDQQWCFHQIEQGHHQHVKDL